MKLKHWNKYISIMAILTCMALLFINFTSLDEDKVEGRPSRIISSSEKVHISDHKESVSDEGTRKISPTMDGTSKNPIQPLPNPNVNEPVVLIPLI